MQAILISDKILHEQICTVCKKYLSHGPIKITYRGVKCGRCSAESDIGAISYVNSVFEFESVIFPCINRYEGCSQLLKFQDVPKHEETCIGKEYLCPLCPEAKYSSNSLLYLLNHYRNVHRSEIISEPFIIIDIETRKEHVYLYCNDLESMVIFINIKFNGDILSITPSTTFTDNLNNVKYNVSIVEDGCQKYNSSGEVCGVNGLNCNAHEVDLETLLLKKCTTSVQCIFNFDVFTTLKVISLSNIKSNCIESYGHSHNNNHPTYLKISRVLHSSVGDRRYRYKICNLCENYVSSCGHINIYVCSGKSICGVCFYNGIIDCHIEANIDNCRFYCRYECKQSFNASELIMHEKQCLLNTDEHLDDKTFGMLHFGNYFCINSDDAKSLIVRSNLVTYNLDVFGTKGRIYMVTDHFKCIIFYETDKSVSDDDGLYIRFRAAHQYFPDQYCIKFKVVKHGVLPTEEVTTRFSIDLVTSKKFFFCVFLRKTVFV